MPWYRVKSWVTEKRVTAAGRHTPGSRIEYTREFRAANRRQAEKKAEAFGRSTKKHTLGVGKKEKWKLAMQKLDRKPRDLRGKHVDRGPVYRRVVYRRKGKSESYEGEFRSLHTLRKGEVKEVRKRARKMGGSK